MDAMLPRMMEATGVTEELKARDPMRWVGLMNTLKAQAEEMVSDRANLSIVFASGGCYSRPLFVFTLPTYLLPCVLRANEI